MHRLAAVAACCAMPAAAFAQGIGIKGGLAYGSVPNNGGVYPGQLSPASGYAVGVAVASTHAFGLGVDALYAQRGFTSSVSGGSRELSYLDVPVYVQVQAPHTTVAPFAYAGPQVSFEMSCRASGGSCPDGRSKVGYAGVIGGGVRFRSLGRLSVEGRYVYGLTDLKASTVTEKDNYKTRGFMLLLGVGF
ncbi:MAG TPA: porin family protein [Gemmatimonadaceae bacterium]|nr:porin family protein [Gemmatimonadaceae bacterium]